MTVKKTVLISGGGASGTLLAANLLREAPFTRVVVIEPRAELGRGMAYSTPCGLHLLNVPAGKMSAFPDEPSHFLRWLADNGFGQYGPSSFVPRRIYGAYLASLLEKSTVEHVRTSAVFCRADGRNVELRLSDGEVVTGNALVLATGNAAPAPWPDLSGEVQATGRFFNLVWQPNALHPTDSEEPVLLLGSGLTAVDAALALRVSGHRGTITMVSRRGLLPETHRLFSCTPMACPSGTTARELLRNMRANAHCAEALHGNWRVAVDGVRPETNPLWQALPQVEQRRFLRHLRAYWDVHRHRMAPEISAEIHALIAAGVLQVVAGRAGQITPLDRALRVTVTRRGATAPISFEAGRIINCTGPESNLKRLRNPLVQSLLASGAITPHPLRMGAQVDSDGALLGREGNPSPHLFAIGPLRLGSLLESVAIPEIRQQARDLAGRLLSPSAYAGLDQRCVSLAS